LLRHEDDVDPRRCLRWTPTAGRFHGIWQTRCHLGRTRRWQPV